MLGLLAALGCGKEPEPAASPVGGVVPAAGAAGDEQSSAAPQPTGVAPVAASEAPPISRELQEAFVERVNAAVAASDAQALNACIDWSGMFDRVIASLSFPDEAARGLKTGLLQSINGPAGLASQIVAPSDGGEYQLIRLHVRNGRPHALFRFSGDDGLNYHDYLLAEQGGRVVAMDLYVFMTGEYLSETFRRALIPAAQQFSKNWIQKLASSDRAFLENFEKLAEMNVPAGASPQRALRVYRSLPKELQEIKPVQILRLQAAYEVGEREVLAATDDFQRLYPDDPALALLLLDPLIIRKQFDEALAMIEELDESVGGDPYLHLQRASLYLEKGDFSTAKDHARKLVEAYPDNQQHHFVLLSVLIDGQDYEAAYEQMHAIAQDFQLEWGDLRDDEYYAGFAASEPGQRWLRETGFLPPAEEPIEDPEPGPLQWTDSTGQRTIEAFFVEADDRSVTLKKLDGRTVTVPLSRLDEASREQAAAEKNAAAAQ